MNPKEYVGLGKRFSMIEFAELNKELKSSE